MLLHNLRCTKILTEPVFKTVCFKDNKHTHTHTHGVIKNDVSNYLNVYVRIAHIICNHSLYKTVYKNAQ